MDTSRGRGDTVNIWSFFFLFSVSASDYPFPGTFGFATCAAVHQVVDLLPHCFDCWATPYAVNISCSPFWNEIYRGTRASGLTLKLTVKWGVQQESTRIGVSDAALIEKVKIKNKSQCRDFCANREKMAFLFFELFFLSCLVLVLSSPPVWALEKWSVAFNFFLLSCSPEYNNIYIYA